MIELYDSLWYYNLPVFCLNVGYSLVLNYEIKTYFDAAEFLTMNEMVQTKYILSKILPRNSS